MSSSLVSKELSKRFCCGGLQKREEDGAVVEGGPAAKLCGFSAAGWKECG